MTAIPTLNLKAGQIVTVDGWEGTSLITNMTPWGTVEVNPGYYDTLPVDQITGIIRTLTARELPEGAVVLTDDVSWTKEAPQPGRLAWVSVTGDEAGSDEMDVLLASGAEIFRVDWDSGEF